jgi:TolB-like protein
LTEFAAISLRASNQLALLHVGQNQEAGFFYYVMELADDIETGREIDIDHYTPCTLSALQRKKGRLATGEAVSIALELARGLTSLHSHGLVHRDIKPANIIFVGGTPKLADIGLVANAQPGQSMIGTEGFIPPEGPGTAAADVYSAGKVLYELNTGLDRKSFPILPTETKDAINHRQFLDLNEIVLRACAPNPSRRYRNADELLRDLSSLHANRGLLLKRVSRWLSPVLLKLLVALTVVAIAAAGAWLWPKISPRPAHLADGATNSRSIAVLPFENLSADPAFQSFVDGMHEDVILGLAKVRELRVISRTSVVGYKQQPRKLRQIAADLGVTNILEGAVQRQGSQAGQGQDSKVRISVRLVDARTDSTIWSTSYDKNLTDTFNLQTLLSEQIAEALQTKLTASERRLIARRTTTQDPEAHRIYLEGFRLNQQLGYYGRKDEYERVIELFKAAIAQDPDFAEAYVQLSLAHSSLYRFSYGDPSPKQLAEAADAAMQAARMAPAMPEIRLARGVINYLGDRDWQNALREFRAAEAELPNDELLQWWVGNTLRRLGRWDEAVRYFLSSSSLNPRPLAPAGGITAVQTLRYLRRFVQARDLAKAQLQRFPYNRVLQTEFAKCQFEVDGDRTGFISYMETRAPGIHPNSQRPSESVLLTRQYECAYLRADWDAAERIFSDKAFQGMSENPSYINTPAALYRALVAYLTNKPEEIRINAARTLLEYEGNWNSRQTPWVRMGRARAFALLGQATDALREASTAWAAVENTDAQDAAIMLQRVGEVHIILGRADDAFKALRRMMAQPTDLGPEALRLDPLWRRLATDRRFEEILRSAKAL